MIRVQSYQKSCNFHNITVKGENRSDDFNVWSCDLWVNVLTLDHFDLSKLFFYPNLTIKYVWRHWGTTPGSQKCNWVVVWRFKSIISARISFSYILEETKSSFVLCYDCKDIFLFVAHVLLIEILITRLKSCNSNSQGVVHKWRHGLRAPGEGSMILWRYILLRP